VVINSNYPSDSDLAFTNVAGGRLGWLQHGFASGCGPARFQRPDTRRQQQSKRAKESCENRASPPIQEYTCGAAPPLADGTTFFKKHNLVDRKPDAGYQSIEFISLLENVGAIRELMT
jgi:hypothetical protein